MNVRLLHKITGSLLWLEASLMLVCFFISLYYQEDDVLPFGTSIIVTAAVGFFMRYYAQDADNNLGRRDAYFLVTSTWIVFSLFGMLPFIIGGYIPGLTNAFFETMSGFTTTGATILDDVECLPHGILFWRTMTQWIGGLGIVFFTIAILPSFVSGGSIKIFAAEATGPIRTKLHSRLSTNSHFIWTIYIVLTSTCAVLYYVGGMSVFDCINYAMTTTATGGFSTHNNSTEFFNSPFIEYIGALFCLLSGINFALLYNTVVKGRIVDFYRNSEVRLYLSIILIATVLLMIFLISYNHYDVFNALRFAFFQSVSFLTSTGLFSDDAGQWHHVTWIILGVLMFIGGCAGSTGGGFKVVRIIMLIQIIRNEFRKILHPNAVLSVKVGQQVLHNSMHTRLLALLALYLIIFLVGSGVMAAMGVDVVNSITIALSCLSNVGPTLGVEIGPTMSWDQIPALGKWICTFMMLAGRLEIFSVLIIFSPEFWKNT